MDALFLFVFILTYLDVLGVESEKVKHFFPRLMGGMRGWGRGGGGSGCKQFSAGLWRLLITDGSSLGFLNK